MTPKVHKSSLQIKELILRNQYDYIYILALLANVINVLLVANTMHLCIQLRLHRIFANLLS